MGAIEQGGSIVTTIKEVRVPDIGEFKDVPVIEVLVKPGDAVKAEDSLITLESDKATLEVPSPLAGVVKEVKLKVGDKVSEGSLILTLEANEEGAAAPEARAPASGAAAAPEPPPPPEPELSGPLPTSETTPIPTLKPPPLPLVAATSGTLPPHASPAVRRFARELGVDLEKVRGSGPKGRILKEDVQAYVKNALARPAVSGLALPELPQVDFAKFGPVEERPLSRIKKLAGANLHRNWIAIPHVTQHDEADITELEAFRKAMAEEAKAQGVRLTLLAFIMKACVAALERFPQFNASLCADGETLVIKRYYHIGVAVDTPDGLVVPVIRDADKKGVLELAKELAEAAAAARDKQLKPGALQGGSFSISSLGGIGGSAFTPIVNAPEVAILGVSRAALKPVFQNGAFVPRLLLPLSLSYDHRVIDGAEAARFTTYLCAVLSDIRRILL